MRKRKLILVLMALIMSVTTFNVLSNIKINADEQSAPESSYSRTALFSVDDFNDLSEYVNAGGESEDLVITIEKELNFNYGEFIPLGTSEHPFRGVFDGQGFRMLQINIEGNSDYVGVFGKTENAIIKNIEIAYSNFEGNNYVGALVGYAYATEIINVFTSEVTISGVSNTGDLIGYSNNIFEISSAEDLKNMAEFVNNGNLTRGTIYRLTDNIVLNDIKFEKDGDYSLLETFIPIGNSQNIFNGTFDGNGKKISGLYIDSTKLKAQSKDSEFIGLFGYIENARIKNLTIENSFVNGEVYASLLCGNSLNTNIDDITVNNVIINGESYLSTICSQMSDTFITNCVANNIEIYGNGFIGGIVGEVLRKSQLSTITNCSTSGKLTGRNTIGGIIGIAQTSFQKHILEIKNCFNYINIISLGSLNGSTMDCYELGGIAGKTFKTIVTNCKNNGKFLMATASEDVCPIIEDVGGIVGFARYDSIIQGCENNQEIIGYYRVGGICGSTEDSAIKNCINNSKVSGREYIGGIVGKSYIDDETSVLESNTNYGDIYGLSMVGGIAGKGKNIIDCKSNGNIYLNSVTEYIWKKQQPEDPYKLTQKIKSDASYAGGIVGYIDSKDKHDNDLGVETVINNSTFNGKIEVVIDSNVSQYIGGIAGYVDNATIKNCYAKGTIVANAENVGGLVGYLENNSALENSYSVVNIEKEIQVNYVGGLVGQVSESIVNNCFVMRDVEGDSYYGAIVGNLISGTVSNCYYPNNLKVKAINNQDSIISNCISLDYSMFRNEGNGSLTQMLNSLVTKDNGYHNWQCLTEYPELYVIINYSKLYYDLNGGIGVFVDENTYLRDQEIELDFTNIPKREKYEFIGYILNGNTNVVYNELNKKIVLTQEENILKALWQIKQVNEIVVEDFVYNYIEGEERFVLINPEYETDIVKYSIDGKNYTTEPIKYEMPGEYTIFFKVEREDYFEYASQVKLIINKNDINISNLAWQRQWLITSLNSYQTQEIENNKFTYNSYENEITLISARIPYEILDVKYYVNNELVESLICKDAGNYSITAVLEYDKTIYNEINNIITLNFTIEKRVVSKPVASTQNSFEFIDSDITLEISNLVETDKSAYTVLNNTNRYVGNYTAVCVLKDKKNFVWTDGTIEDVTFDYEITKKAINLPIVEQNTYEYDGKSHKLAFTSISDLFAVLNNKEQINVGKYEIIVYLIDTKNYEVKNQQTKTNFVYEMEITPLKVSKPSVSKTAFDYDGNKKTLNIQDTDKYTVINQSNTVAGTYKAIISLKDKLNTVWSTDLSTNDIEINYVINKRKVQKPSIKGTYTYNGSIQTADIDTSTSYSILNNQRTNEGTQTVAITLVDKANTCWEDNTIEDLMLEFVIAPARMPVIETADIKPTLENDKLVTNFDSLIVEGAKVTYSLSKDGEYTTTIDIEEDGTYTIYYKVEKENHKTITGTFKVERALDIEEKSPVGTIVLVIVLILLVLGGGFVFYAYNAKILFFKQANNEKVDKRLPFEIHEEKQEESKEKKEKTKNNSNPEIKERVSTRRTISHLGDDLKKALANKISRKPKEEVVVNEETLKNDFEDENQELETQETILETQNNVNLEDEEQNNVQVENENNELETKQEECDLKDNTTEEVTEETKEEIKEEVVQEKEDSILESTTEQDKKDKKGFKFGKKDKKKEEIVSSKTVNIIPTFDDDDEI